MSETDYIHFDIGVREQIDENTTYHGSGWHTEDGDTVLNPGPDLKLVLRDDGSLSVWEGRRRAW